MNVGTDTARSVPRIAKTMAPSSNVAPRAFARARLRTSFLRIGPVDLRGRDGVKFGIGGDGEHERRAHVVAVEIPLSGRRGGRVRPHPVRVERVLIKLRPRKREL